MSTWLPSSVRLVAGTFVFALFNDATVRHVAGTLFFAGGKRAGGNGGVDIPNFEGHMRHIAGTALWEREAGPGNELPPLLVHGYGGPKKAHHPVHSCLTRTTKNDEGYPAVQDWHRSSWQKDEAPSVNPLGSSTSEAT